MLGPNESTPQHRIADSNVDPLRASLVGMIYRLRRDLSTTDALALAMNPEGRLPVDLSGELEALLRPALERVHGEAMQLVYSQMGAKIAKVAGAESAGALFQFRGDEVVADFSAPRPRSLRYAQERAGALVAGVTEQQRAGIRDVVTRSVRDGGNPHVIARDIESVVGLDRRRANAVVNLRRRLEARGVAPSVVDRRIRGYRERALRSRAETIARTEVLDAMNAGLNDGWREAIGQFGGLNPDRARRVWIITYDELTCPTCRPLDGQVALLDQPFPSGHDRPPIHSNCRCTMGVVPVEMLEEDGATTVGSGFQLVEDWSGEFDALDTSGFDAETLDSIDARLSAAFSDEVDRLADLSVDQTSLRLYQRSRYEDINEGLRRNRALSLSRPATDSGLPPDLPQVTNLLEAAERVTRQIEKGPRAPFNITTYRGVRGEFATELWENADEFVDHGFASTTFSERAAARFARRGSDGVVMEIRSPKGTKGFHFNSHEWTEYSTEREWLLQRGTRFKVVDRYEVEKPGRTERRLVVQVVDQPELDDIATGIRRRKPDMKPHEIEILDLLEEDARAALKSLDDVADRDLEDVVDALAVHRTKTPAAKQLADDPAMLLDDGPLVDVAIEQMSTFEHNGIKGQISQIVKDPDGPGRTVTVKFVNDAGTSVGSARWSLTEDVDGLRTVFLRDIHFDPEVQGQGVGSVFLERLEANVVALGADTIRLQANIDVGGYAWAKAGFDWLRPSDYANVLEKMALDARKWGLEDQFQAGTGFSVDTALEEAKSMIDLNEWGVGGAQPRDGVPTPFQLSQVGSNSPADGSWLGKDSMLGSNWQAEKVLL